MISATERLRYIVAVSLIGIQSEIWIINHCLGLGHEKNAMRYMSYYVLMTSTSAISWCGLYRQWNVRDNMFTIGATF